MKRGLIRRKTALARTTIYPCRGKALLVHFLKSSLTIVITLSNFHKMTSVYTPMMISCSTEQAESELRGHQHSQKVVRVTGKKEDDSKQKVKKRWHSTETETSNDNTYDKGLQSAKQQKLPPLPAYDACPYSTFFIHAT
ncbi:7c3e304b-0672-4bcf-8821-5797e2dbe6b9 [Sclerotinia trifoliorum]|uniref:7c3e304b-0672-4bcf-8821-5797e2dbe6b9 n=1 Tax=Sclerotinia trifoliorum TaxID=28548 RepID=A0A8H2ZVG1_9HELO|nr:7c3e304b-0672-4bcf-8821-5797e2dbe6b9 [Sclerotinia trifoliorum]